MNILHQMAVSMQFSSKHASVNRNCAKAGELFSSRKLYHKVAAPEVFEMLSSEFEEKAKKPTDGILIRMKINRTKISTHFEDATEHQQAIFRNCKHSFQLLNIDLDDMNLVIEKNRI